MSHPARSSLRSIPTALVSSLSIISLLYSPHASAQNITTSPVPPLQWINLTNLLTGQAAPPLKDASIGYDDNKRNLVIFGGESSQGLAQSDTFLLNLDTLTWSSLDTLASPSKIKPPARSAAISGEDNAVNYRHSHIIIGGKSATGSALNDVWEFDYSDEFWSQVTISGPQPSGRWGAAGGADLTTPFIQDPTLSWPNNSYYFAGGFDGKSPIPLSDVWRLNITGFLSSNNIDDVVGSWEQLSVSGGGVANADLVGLAGGVVQHTDQYIVAVGGCNGTDTASDSCAEGNLFILDTDTGTATSPAACPAPRIGGAIAINQNTASQSFAGQMFFLLGTFNSSLWNDGGGLVEGEVGILNAQTGAWSRVLPAGDPGTTGKPAFPSPREGAAVFSWTSALVGGSRSSATDTIVFGGRDANGNYLSELWLLRAYNGVIQSSDEHWSGYGDGTLTTGTNATGAGVTVKFMTQCASAISSPSGTSTSSSSGKTGSTPTSSSSGGQPSPTNSQAPGSTPTANPYDTSTTHKVLAPVSAALVFPAIVFHRLSQPYISSNGQTNPKTGFLYLAGVVALASFALGIAGLATAFTSLTHTAVSSIVKRSTPENLATAHGRAGLAFWIGLYGLVPILIVINLLVDRHNAANEQQPSRLRRASNEFAEKLGLYQHRGASPVSPPADIPPPTASTPRFHSRVRSWGGATLSRFSLGHARHSSEASAVIDGASSPSSNSFEVTNRPQRTRHYSGNSLAAFSDPRPSLSPQNLSDTSWMRRSPGPSGDHRGEPPSTPGTAVLETMSTNGLVGGSSPGHPIMPTPLKILTRTLLHAFLIGLCALTLAALWLRAPVAGFAVFLAWTVCSYILIFALAWYGIPRESTLTVVLFRLRTNPSHHINPNGTATPHPASSVALECFPNEGHGPYQHHQPTYRTAQDSEYPTSLSHAGHTVEDEYEDDEDEETRQRRIEDEMSRREVAIITTPKRRLVVKNPETS